MTNGVTVNYVYDSDDSRFISRLRTVQEQRSIGMRKTAQGDVIGIVDANKQ
jgi:hypothetical protein